ncbi:acetate/propionate family kinase [Phenylobacterium sp. 20VBR1]|uniref:Acetate kinase n=1 Tax=Phenylobacterium glaciei TaxID=2803784 RepID=A0A941D578_9CAUL|nr:acetate/propionate family kinase [Phenylobacterium glaciei]MBR7621013.1 acetate/propionate family kinase [Phenylobacterium glaciei]
MSDAVLTLNAGSSSLKFALYTVGGPAPRLMSRGQIEGVGTAPHLVAKGPDGAVLAERRWTDADLDHEAFFATLLAFVDDHLGGDRLCAIGHRIVHGGADFSRPVLVDDRVLARLEVLSPLAPLHQPHNLAAVRLARSGRPGLPQVACFDTAFHHGHASVVTRFALPRTWHEQGVRRYGFHGLSYEFIADELRGLDPALAAGRVIVAHLGNGASLCAIHDGRSVDTTMGFTALDGLMMGTRCGALDPGVILYLQQQGLTPDAVQTLLYEQSGLLGVSGLSSDMRVLLASLEPAAKEAVELFVYRIVREIGALAASMGGLDGLVFTAGIGENAPAIRAGVAERLGWTGLTLDGAANRAGQGLVSATQSRLKAWVIPTDEEMIIARHTMEVVESGGA